jgi:hypothetical protein
MPKSLDTGVSMRVPVKVPAPEKQALIDVLRDGETISSLTRELWRREVKRRQSRLTADQNRLAHNPRPRANMPV